MWDTAGGVETLERLGASFWRKAAAFLYVFNIGDAQSFSALSQLRSLLQDQVLSMPYACRDIHKV